jgi:predicted nucleic-acid-binding protein
MTALDTNVLVRIITKDDKDQATRAVEFLSGEDRVFLAKTVLLELEWVLRSGYRYAPRDILSAFRSLLSIGNVEIEDEAAVRQAVEWYEAGMDFADSLHIASAGQLCTFATFDAALRRRGEKLGVAEFTGL